MEIKKKNKKTKIVSIIIIAVLVLSIGGAFAAWSNAQFGENQLLVAGNIYMKYNGINQINASNMMPRETYDPDTYFKFSVEGFNTFKDKDVVYDISITHGDEPDPETGRTERIKDNLLRFRLVEITTDEEGNEVEEELIDDESYTDLTDKRIWVDLINKETDEEITRTYKLYMWISKDAKIGVGENVDYDMDTWSKKVYASVKIKVTGDFEAKEITDDYLIVKAVQIPSLKEYNTETAPESEEDIKVILRSMKEVTKFVVTNKTKETQQDYEVTKNGRSWDTDPIIISETGEYEYYAVYPNASNTAKFKFKIKIKDDRILLFDKPTAEMCKQGLVYNGKPQELVDNNQAGYYFEDYEQTTAGKHNVKAKLRDKYKKWKDQSSDDVTIQCSIDKVDSVFTLDKLEDDSLADGKYVKKYIARVKDNIPGTFEVKFNNENATSQISGNNITVNITSDTESQMTVTFKPTDESNYNTWKEIYTIRGHKTATVGTCKDVTYNGSSQTLIDNGIGVTYENATGTEANDYEVKVKLQSGFKWELDDSTGDRTITCKINPKDILVTPTYTEKKFGEEDQEITYTNSGAIEPQVPLFEGKLEREKGENVGSYKFLIGTLTLKDNDTFKASNYKIKLADIKFNINKSDLKIILDRTADNSINGEKVTKKIVASNNLDINGLYSVSVADKSVTAIVSNNVISVTLPKTLTTQITVKFTPRDSVNYDPVTTVYTINGSTYKQAKIGTCNNSNYTGYQQNILNLGETNGEGIEYSNYLQTDAGTYDVTAKLNPEYIWDDGSVGDKTLKCKINKIKVGVELERIGVDDEISGIYIIKRYKKIVTPPNAPGKVKITFSTPAYGSSTEEGDNIVAIKMLADTEVDIIASFETTDPTNFEPAEASTVHAKGSRVADIGTCNELYYNGENRILIDNGIGVTYDNPTGTSVGSYHITATLKEGYKWGDGTSDTTKTIDCSIKKRKLRVIPDNIKVKQGDPEKTLTYGFTGNLYNEKPTFSGTLQREQGSTPGKYLIKQGTLAVSSYSGNYEIVLDEAYYEIVGDKLELILNKTKDADLLSGDSITKKIIASNNLGVDGIYTASITGENAKASVKGNEITVTLPNNSQATLMVKFSPKNADMYTPVIKKLTLKGEKYKVATIGTCNNSFVYDGIEHDLLNLGDTEGEGITYSKNNLQVDAGTYTITAKLDDNYVWEDNTSVDKELKCTLEQRELTVTPNSGLQKEFSSSDPSIGVTYDNTISGESPSFSGSLSRESGTDVGSYKILPGSFKLRDNYAFKAKNYKFKLADATFKIVKPSLSITIAKLPENSIASSKMTKKIKATLNKSISGRYTATPTNPLVETSVSGNEITIVIPTSVAKDTISIAFIPNDTNNVDVASKTYEVTSSKYTTVSLTSCNNLTYNGTERELLYSSSTTGVTYSTHKYTDAGDYTITATLQDGYIWNDQTVDAKKLNCKINKIPVTITPSSTNSTVYYRSSPSISYTSDISSVRASGHTDNDVYIYGSFTVDTYKTLNTYNIEKVSGLSFSGTYSKYKNYEFKLSTSRTYTYTIQKGTATLSNSFQNNYYDNYKIAKGEQRKIRLSSNETGKLDVTLETKTSSYPGEIKVTPLSKTSSSYIDVIVTGGDTPGKARLRYSITPNNTTDTKSNSDYIDFEVIESEDDEDVSGVATTVIKDTLGKDNGVIGVSTENEKVTSEEEEKTIREYRYSGVNVNNYIEFNDELWRIIGVFKDENNKEHLKIIRNQYIYGLYPNDYYVVDGIQYHVRSSDGYSYWGRTYDNGGYASTNDWTKAGLMYWLNSKGDNGGGYYNTLSSTAKSMVADSKYYLGNVYYSSKTVADVYGYERGTEKCTSLTSCEAGKIWPGSQASWTGKIGLMYPSDFGFSTDSQYWTSYISGNYSYNWMYKTMRNFSNWNWTISPYISQYNVLYVGSGISYTSSYSSSYAFPTLYLKSDAYIISGKGTENSPYVVAPTKYITVDTEPAKVNLTAKNKIATLGTCNDLVYSGDSQPLVTGGVGVIYDNQVGKDAGDYEVTATTELGYAFEDGSIVKTLNCSIDKKDVPVSYDRKEFSYTGKFQAPTATAYGVNGEKLDLAVTDASSEGDHVAIATMKEVNNNYNLINTVTDYKITSDMDFDSSENVVKTTLKVNYYLRNKDGSSYTLFKSVEKEAYKGDIEIGEVLDFNNYVEPKEISLKIVEGENVINYYYEREK